MISFELENPNWMYGVSLPSSAAKKRSNSIVQSSGNAFLSSGVTSVLSASSSHLPFTPFIEVTFPLPVLFHLAGKSAKASCIKSSWKMIVLPGTKSENEAAGLLPVALPVALPAEDCVVVLELLPVLLALPALPTAAVSAFAVLVLAVLSFFLKILLMAFPVLSKALSTPLSRAW